MENMITSKYDSIEEIIEDLNVNLTQKQKCKINKFIQFVKNDEVHGICFYLTTIKLNNGDKRYIALDEYTYNLGNFNFKNMDRGNSLLIVYKSKIIDSTMDIDCRLPEDYINSNDVSNCEAMNRLACVTILNKCSIIDSNITICNYYNNNNKKPLDNVVHLQNAIIKNYTHFYIGKIVNNNPIDVNISNTVIDCSLFFIKDKLNLNNSKIECVDHTTITSVSDIAYKINLHRISNNKSNVYLVKNSKTLFKILSQEVKSNSDVCFIIQDNNEEEVIVYIKSITNKRRLEIIQSDVKMTLDGIPDHSCLDTVKKMLKIINIKN